MENPSLPVEFVIYSDVVEDRGRYRLNLVLKSGFEKFREGEDQAYEGIIDLRVIMLDSDFTPPNAAPVFQPALESSVSIEIGDSWSYTLPDVVDPECLDPDYVALDGECDITISMSADPGIIANEVAKFFALESVASAPGSYKMSVTLSDGLDNSEDYSIELTINEPVAEIEISIEIETETEDLFKEEEVVVQEAPEIKPDPLIVAYKGISKSGEITLKFN